MVCELVDSAAQALWPSLLQLRQFLATSAAQEADQVAFVLGSGGWELITDRSELERARQASNPTLFLPLNSTAALPEGLNVYLNEEFQAGGSPMRMGDRPLELAASSVFRVYLPMILGGFLARKRGKLFVTAHVAQTLDGRIACLNGHSQWISNHANLVHSHRLRALHDGVLVGRGTVESDDPALTVRHVGGTDPRRIVLNGSASLLKEAPTRFQVLRDSGCLLITSEENRREVEEQHSVTRESSVEVLGVELAAGESCSSQILTDVLLARGIHSVFLEGGSTTLSKFFDARAIDLLHVHFAPIILGSGIPSFSLPEVEKVQLARRMTTAHFVLDGELLIECRGQSNESNSQADSPAVLSESRP